MTNENIALEMSPVGPWYSRSDEDAYFHWLNSIKCVEKYEGALETLYIDINPDLVDQYALEELVALFYRYDVDMKQLTVFDSENFSTLELLAEKQNVYPADKMITKGKIVLEMSPVGPFYARGDEDSFFHWLSSIKSVEKYEGQGRVLYIDINPDLLDQYALKEIIALFHRYDVDMKQLAIFDTAEFSRWIRNKEAYWYPKIFG